MLNLYAKRGRDAIKVDDGMDDSDSLQRGRGCVMCGWSRIMDAREYTVTHIETPIGVEAQYVSTYALTTYLNCSSSNGTVYLYK